MTLSLSWATSANYIAGPDTGTPTKVDPASAANGFIRGTVIAPQHVNFLINAIEVALAKAVDGINGGTYAMTAPLILTGAGPLRTDNLDIEDTGRVRATGHLDILSSANLNVKSGGDIEIESGGDINVQGGGNININVSATGGHLNVLPSGTIEVSNGGFINLAVGGQILAGGASGLAYNGIASAWKHTLTPVGFTDWGLNGIVQWVQQAAIANNRITFGLALRPGDTLSSVTVRLNGAIGAGHAGLAVQFPPFIELVSVDNIGGRIVIATLIDPSSAVVYDTAHNVTVDSATPGSTLPETVATNKKYYVVMTGERGTNSVASTLGVLDVTGTGLARGVRTANELI